MNKTANLYARIEPDVKEQAENVLETLGISVSSAINMFYKQIILQQGIPFDVKIPKAPENSAKWSKERLDAELEKGYNDMLKGRTRPAAMVLSDVKKKYKVCISKSIFLPLRRQTSIKCNTISGLNL